MIRVQYFEININGKTALARSIDGVVSIQTFFGVSNEYVWDDSMLSKAHELTPISEQDAHDKYLKGNMEVGSS